MTTPQEHSLIEALKYDLHVAKHSGASPYKSERLNLFLSLARSLLEENARLKEYKEALNVLLAAHTQFRKVRGFHKGKHDSQSLGCSRCEQAYVHAEDWFDELFEGLKSRKPITHICGISGFDSTKDGRCLACLVRTEGLLPVLKQLIESKENKS